jgi:hypothetical protein
VATSVGSSLPSEIVPEIIPDDTEETGMQNILQSVPRHRWISAFTDTQFYWTSNAFSSDTDTTETSVMVNTAQVALNPPVWFLGNGQINSQIAYRHQWFNYGLANVGSGLGNSDFDAQTVASEVSYSQDDWAISGGLDWSRLLSHDSSVPDYTQFYSETTPRFSLTKAIPLQEDSSINFRYDLAIYLTDVSDQDGLTVRRTNNRAEQGLTIAYLWAATPQLILQPYYQFLYSDYTTEAESRREDFLNSLGLIINYEITPWASIRTFLNYNNRLTNSALSTDYESFNGGLGTSFNIQF